MLASIPGFFTGLSLIIAIGAQNAFVIRQGLTRKHVLLVVAICAVSDAALIVLGVAGLGALISGLPWLLEIIRWFGVLYLTWFGIKSLRSAFKVQALDASGAQSGSGFGAKAASGFMSKPAFWKVLDVLIAVVMFSIAIMLALYSF
jgi:L-lysine exporter family protein LysE/ArgO